MCVKLKMYPCDQCSKVLTRKDSLARHKSTIHDVTLTRKRKDLDEENETEYPPLEQYNNDGWKMNQTLEFGQEEPLQKSNAVPNHNIVSKDNMFDHQALATRSKPLKFKHPFCMMVSGPSRSGKTQWTVRLLNERHKHIDTPVDRILFCYSQWQHTYDELKRLVPMTHFHQGLPSLETMRSLQNAILVLDDLMEETVKDPNIMNMFVVGSHHRNISVLFLMQNIFQKGPHTRTISINTQYMVLFKNARDQMQIRILARQIFPTGWCNFLKYYEEETSKPYGHVILDFHPQTHGDDRIVKLYQPEQTMLNDTVENKREDTTLVGDCSSKQQPVLETVVDNKVKSDDLAVLPSGNENVNKLMNILREHGYNPDESSSDEEAIDWNTPL